MADFLSQETVQESKDDSSLIMKLVSVVNLLREEMKVMRVEIVNLRGTPSFREAGSGDSGVTSGSGTDTSCSPSPCNLSQSQAYLEDQKECDLFWKGTKNEQYLSDIDDKNRFLKAAGSYFPQMQQLR